MKLRTVLVDDEPLALDRLRKLLSEEDGIEVVGEFGNGAQTLGFLRQESVDVLLIDIEMPVMNGIDVLKQIGGRAPLSTIFVTAYPEYAVDAFELHALDYLTKPVKPERLRKALARVRERIEARTALSTQASFSAVLDSLRTARSQPNHLSRLLVKDGVKDVIVHTDTIEWIEAADYYNGIRVKGRTFLIRETTTQLSQKLDPSVFVRIHRSAIVNIRYVKEIYREGPDEGTVVMADGKRFTMSKSGRQRLLEVSRV